VNALSAEIIAKICTLRKAQRISARRLADRMTAGGHPVTQSVIANYETRLRGSLPLDFANAAARALGTNLGALLSGPGACPTCDGEPPKGFTCNTCGGAR
jgi:transcriptional regulator with XRE-family HTH domain